MNRKIQKFFNFFRNLRNPHRKGQPISFFDYLDRRTVIFLDALSIEEALKTLVQALNETGKIKNKEEFYNAILKREKTLSTGIGLGIAIPHAKLACCKDFFIAIGIQKEKGLNWNSFDGLPVRLIFLIGGPINQQSEYLNILARLTWALKNPKKREAILKALTSDRVVNLFKWC